MDFNATLEQKNFHATIHSTGEKNTASNIGSGAEVFKGKQDFDLQFRTIKSSDGTLIIVQDASTLDILLGSAGTGYTQEEIEDFVGAMVTGNTETGISVTYDDLNSKLNFDATHNHTGVYEPANANIQLHIASTSNPHTVTSTQVGLGNCNNTSDLNKPISTATQTALDTKVDENLAITAATKTKITYDIKGLVTAGADATTADIADSLNKRYVTDANLTVIGNTSGTNTGDQVVITDHTALSNLNTASYTHLTATNHTDLTDAGDTTLHYHAADRNCDNHASGTTNKVYTVTEQTKLSGIAVGAEVNVNADWNSSSGDSQILNKPSIPSQYTDEMAQDAIGGMSVDTTTINVTYTDVTPELKWDVVDNTSIQKIEVVKNSGAVVSTRKQLNFIEGSNITLTIADDGVNNQADITIAGSGGSYSDELAQDAVGGMVINTATVNMTYTDLTPSLQADLNATLKTNYDTAYSHSQSNSQSHSDYLINNGDDISSGSLTLQGGTVTIGKTDTAGQIVLNNGSGATDTLTYTELVDLTDAGATTLHKHDHGGQDGLSDDDHTQYALLAGRAGGQTLIGGTGAGDDIHLQTTSNATKGTYFIDELTSNGFVKTSSSNGTLSVDTSTYLTGNQSITLSSDVTGSGTTAITTTIANDAVTYAKMQNVSATDKILGRQTTGSGDVEEITCTASGRALLDDTSTGAQKVTLGINFTKSITVESPTSSEDISMFFTDIAITIVQAMAVLVGSATPSVTYQVRHDTDRNATGNALLASPQAVTSTTSGQENTSFSDATIPANSFVWLETTAQSGTVASFHLTLRYTED